MRMKMKMDLMTELEQNDLMEQVNLMERGTDDSIMEAEESRRRQRKRNMWIGGFFATLFLMAIFFPMTI